MSDDDFLTGLSMRVRPANLMAEAAVLGALLANNRIREECLSLEPDDFSDPDYARLYAWVISEIDLGRRVDAVSLRGHFEPDLLADVVGSTISLIVGHLVEQIRDCAVRRRLIEIAAAVATRAFDGPGAMALAADFASRLDAIALPEGASGSSLIEDAVRRAEIAMGAALEQKGPVGLSSGFRCIDERLGGLEDETLNVIAARPGMGKTALACDIAIRAARLGTAVLVWSLEMSRLQLARRVLSSASGIPVIAIKRGRVGMDGASRVVEAAKTFLGLPIWIEDGTGVRASAIAVRSRAWRRQHPGPALVIVDHLHIVRPEDGDIRSGATYAVGQVSGALKRLSKSCRVPVIALAQLNRGVEGREDKRPGLADLRASGDIEQDADSVGFLYRHEYYLGAEPEKRTGETENAFGNRLAEWGADKQRYAGQAEVIWAKVRDGSPGVDALLFDGSTTSFAEAE